MSQIKANLLVSGDGDQIPIANTMVFHDGSDTPLASPMAMAASLTVIYTFNPHDNAVALIITVSVESRVGTTLASDGHLDGEYAVIPANITKVWPCQEPIYYGIPGAVAGTAQFWYETA